jgi:serine/threonine protein kinase/Tol biopolymer transport system component
LPVTRGTRLGAYEIATQIGEGGMGQVFRAIDTKLKRQVAIKILPPSVAGDHDRLARFQREAEVLASLNHPHIAAIYGLEEGDGTTALVMELVDGEDLAQRLARGAIPLDEALPIAKQIADALDAAHGQGIIHRDLKPANIKVRADGTVKVLDFGLAKAIDPATGSGVNAANSPTLSLHATEAGIILGTAAYMSPEQARGTPVDKRADIWAFGCVLFEMIACRRVFGETVTTAETIAAILKDEPAWQALPEDTPARIRALLKHCLEKDPRRRLRDIGDASLLLNEASGASESTMPAPRVRPASKWVGRAALAGWIVAAGLALANIFGIVPGYRSSPEASAATVRLELPLRGDSIALSSSALQTFSISGDGTSFVYVARDSAGESLVLQNLATGEFRRLAGTAGAYWPRFSPDGRSIGFMSGLGFKVVPLDGGLPREIAGGAATIQANNWNWNGADRIVVTSPTGLWNVPVNGGAPEPLAKPPASGGLFSSAAALPGGSYLVSERVKPGSDERSIVTVVTPGSTGDRLVVAEGAGTPAFVGGDSPGVGHVVYAAAGRLLAVPFDTAKRQVTGAAVPIVENVEMRANGDLADYSLSTAGTLVFREGALNELVSIDRDSGVARPLSANLRQFALPRLAPDGKHLAVEIQESPHQIWMLDLERDVLSPLTTEPTGSHNFAWAPNGSAIMYTTHVSPPQFGWTPVDAIGQAQRLAIPFEGRVFVNAWSRDGRLALRVEGANSDTIMTLRVDEGTPPKAAGSPIKVAMGQPGNFSPDGSWLAYCDCYASGERPPNVFVQHLDSGVRHQVSVDGGDEPRWAASGRELFFRSGSKMMRVEVTLAGTSAHIGRPQMLFEGDYLEWAGSNYDVSADGKKFVMVRTANANTNTLSVRLNWKSELQQLAPNRR